MITGLVIIPEIAQSREKTIDVMEENREWATGCEWNVYVHDNGTEIKYMVCFDDGGLVIIPEIAESQSQSTEEEIDFAVLQETFDADFSLYPEVLRTAFNLDCEWNVYVNDNGTGIKYIVCFEDDNDEIDFTLLPEVLRIAFNLGCESNVYVDDNDGTEIMYMICFKVYDLF